jgi:putative colanic acid biosynthesis glycosyltransferase WcaI
MRFLILSQYFPPESGAAQARLAAFAKELSRVGHDVEVVTSLPNYPSGRIFPGYRNSIYKCEPWDGVPVRRVWAYPSVGAGLGRVLNYGSFALTSLAALALSNRPDYIFVESPPLTVSFPAFLGAMARQSRVIFNISDLWPDSVVEMQIMPEGWAVRRARDVERWSYRHAAYVCAVTEGIRDGLLAKGVPREKLLFLPNGVDSQRFAPKPTNDQLKQELGLAGKQVVLYAGTHSYANGLDSVLQAADLLRANNSIRFLFVGAGSAKPDLIKLAAQLRLANVTFLDPVPEARVSELVSIALCGMACLADKPIFHSARPAKALAIMSCAKPVLFATGDGGQHLIQEAEAGMVVSINRPSEIAQAIQYLAANPEVAFRFGQNGRDYVVENLSWPKLVADFLQQLAVADTQKQEGRLTIHGHHQSCN